MEFDSTDWLPSGSFHEAGPAYSRWLRVMSDWVLGEDATDGDAEASLHNLFQCVATHVVNSFFFPHI